MSAKKKKAAMRKAPVKKTATPRLPYRGYYLNPKEWDDLHFVGEAIHRYRRQVAVHAYIYYQMDEVVITDHEYEYRVKKLQDLQERYPKISSTVPFMRKFFMDEGFLSTSYHIADAVTRIKTWPYSGVKNTAHHLVRMHYEDGHPPYQSHECTQHFK